jgi:hypothetical protein
LVVTLPQSSGFANQISTEIAQIANVSFEARNIQKFPALTRVLPSSLFTTDSLLKHHHQCAFDAILSNALAPARVERAR